MRYKRKGKCNRCGWCCQNEDCEHFKIEDVATCLIYGQEDRPLKCTIYPSAPPLMTDDCGYYFEDTWEDNKIVKRIL